jgi:hypothetical protein
MEGNASLIIEWHSSSKHLKEEPSARELLCGMSRRIEVTSALLASCQRHLAIGLLASAKSMANGLALAE